MAIVGYTRVSTIGQNPDMQLEKLREYGAMRTSALPQNYPERVLPDHFPKEGIQRPGDPAERP